MADVVGQVPGQLPTFTSGHNPQAGVPGGGTVTSISGVSPIATVPSPIVGAGTVQFPSWPADAPGELTNDGAGVLSWETDVGAFVRLLADPTIDQDVGGFHVTLSGLSDTAFLVNTLTNAQDAKFRGLGTTKGSLELEYTTVAANNFAGLTLLAPTGAAFVQNLFGSGTSGAAVGWDGGDYDLPSGAVLYGGITESHWFKLSGSTDHCGSFQLYDNGLNFFPALTLVSIDGSPAVGAVTIGANPRINAIPPDFSVFHGATTATGLGAERLRITHEFENGQMFFGNVAGAGAAIQAASDLFQFVGDGDSATFAIGVQPSDTGQVQIALHALDAGNSGDGVHFSAYAVPGETEDLGIRVGGFDRIQVPGLNLGSSTEVVFRGNPADPSDTQKSTLFWSATDSGANTFNVSAGIELPNSVGVAGDYVVRIGGAGADTPGTLAAQFKGDASFNLLQSLSGISLLAQTSATDGSNANPTLVVRANTGQLSSPFQVQTATSEVAAGFVPVDGALISGMTTGLVLHSFDDGAGNAMNAVFRVGGIGPAQMTIGAEIDGAPGGLGVTISCYDDVNIGFNTIAMQGDQAEIDVKLSDGTEYAFAATVFDSYTGDGVVDLGASDHKWKDGYFGGNVNAGSFSVADMNAAPASAVAAGVKGEIRWTDGFVYLCTATNTWLRAALTTWI